MRNFLNFVSACAVLLLILLYNAPVSSAQSLNNRVLVVFNGNVPESIDVANHYAARRGIPADNLVRIEPPNDSEISYNQYISQVKNPITDKLSTFDGSGMLYKNKILYIVFSYRTPYRITPGTGATVTISNGLVPGDDGRGTSIDQYVADIWDRTSWNTSSRTQNGNTYYAPSQSKNNQYTPYLSLADHRPSQGDKPTYSVWRLDAPSAEIAKGLVDKALAAETNGLNGIGYFDKDRGGLYPEPDETGATLRGDWDIYRAAEFARRAGFSVVEDEHEQDFGTAPAPLRADNAALYAGTYNLGQYNDAFTWNTGAIGFDFNSDAAASFRIGARWCGGAKGNNCYRRSY